MFYDGPTPPGIFDSFTNIESLSRDLKARPYTDVIMGGGGGGAGPR